MRTIKMLTSAREATTKAFHSAQITAVEFPGCDADLKESRGVEVEFQALEARHLQAHELAHVVQQAAKKQKMWLCSNFRLRVGDLPTERTIRTEKIKFKQEFGPVQAQKKNLLASISEDAHLQDERLPITLDDFAFEIPSADRGRFDEELAKATSGSPATLSVQLEYLDEDGLPLLTLRFPGTLKAVGQAGLFADPADADVPARVVVRPLDTSPTTGELEIIVK
jgi:hypothetical protein